MSNVVDELIAAPFSSREQGDRERIALEGRPLPFPSSTLPDSSSRQSVYDAVPWLTSSAATRHFYCWPCLLFQTPGPGPWTGNGVPSVDAIRKLARGHSEETGHVRATFDLKMFLHRITTAARAATAALPDPEVARRIADVVCSLAAMRRPPDAQNCLDTMELVRKYDCVGKRFSDDAVAWLRDSPDIVRKIMDAVVSTMRRSIARDVLSSRFVSLILTRHSNRKLSSILRYVAANGKVLERFVGFGTASSSVEDHVRNVVGEFGVTSKCVALSLGGAVLPSCEWHALRGALRGEIAPLCLLVPWHGHPLDVVLQQSLSFDPACDRFFKWLADLESFFCGNPELCAQLNKFMPEFMPALNRFMLGESSPRRRQEFAKTEFLTYVQQNRRYFSLFFESLEKNPEAWDEAVLVKADGYRECLRDPATLFFLEAFAKILGVASTLKGHLAQRTLPELKRELDSLLRIEEEEEEEDDAKATTAQAADDAKLSRDFKELFKKHALAEIELRYGDMERFRFCGLFEFSEEGWFERSGELFRNLQECYDHGYHCLKWNRAQALSELEVLRQRGAFSKTSVRDFHEYLHESNLRHSFRSLFEASELILALPLLRADLPPLSDKIERWSDQDFGLLFVESDYLSEIRELPNFHADVFAALSESTSSIEH